MPFHQGDIFWIAPEALSPADPARGSGPAHPHVVVQPDVLNQSRIPTLVVCALTSKLSRMTEPGNVLLDPGEGDLTTQSVVVVSQISTVAKAQLGPYIGRLAPTRVVQILDGLAFQQRSFFADRD